MLRPPERLTVTQAMEKYVHLANAGSWIGPYQSSFSPYMVQPADTLASRDYNSVIFVGPAQSGKALWTETPIATPSGWTTMGELCPGHWVYAENGQPCRVLGVSPIRHDKRCYRVEFDDGTEIIADAEHLWDVDDDYSENRKLLRTETIALRHRYGARKHRFRYAIPNAAPIRGNTQDLAVDPYTLGCWLGDGHTYSSIITSHRDDAVEIVDRIRACYTVQVSPQQTNTVNIHVDPSSMVRGRSIRDGLYDLNLLKSDVDSSNEKHIPNEYLRASVEQRRELLCGLMDTDGWVSGSVCGFSSSVLGLANDVYELIVSLGYKARFFVKNPVYTYKGKQCKGQPSFNLTFVAYNDDDFIPFHLSRKASKVRSRAMGRPTHAERRRIVRVEEVESVPVRCISVDNPSGLFLAGKQMVPTHNTEALILGWLAYGVKVDPADFLVFSPTQSAARDFSMRRVARLHRNSPEIGNLILKNKNSDTRYDKHYRNGMIVNLSWPSVAEFAGRPVGRIALTDYDRMPDDVDGEGSPYDLGSKRTTTFGSFAMTMAESSPSRDISNPHWVRQTAHEAPPCTGILGLYNRGDRRRWYWPCPVCESYFEAKWEDLNWQDRGTVLASAETVVLVCPVNGCIIRQDQRPEMQQWGVWLRDGQSIDKEGRTIGDGVRSTVASFWLNGVAAAFSTWTTLVVNYLNAMHEYERTGSENELKKVWNTDLAQPYLPKALDTERLPEVLKARAEALPYRELEGRHENVHRSSNVGYAIEPLVPPDVRLLVASVDVQQNAFIVQVHGVAGGDVYDLILIDRFAIRKSRRLDEAGEALWVKPAAISRIGIPLSKRSSSELTRLGTVVDGACRSS
jgi:phage terminase large subunit GpA-like protein